MHHPIYLTDEDILNASHFFRKYEGYTITTFLQRWECSYTKVAELLKVHPVTVRKWVCGQHKPPRSTLLQLAIADHVMSAGRKSSHGMG